MTQNQNPQPALDGLAITFEGETCIACHYKRQLSDVAPDWACPSCGVAYVKAEAAEREKQAQLSLQNRIERVEFVQEHQTVDPTEQAKIKSDKSMANLIYILFFGALLGGITAIFAIILAHAYRKPYRAQNWVQTHFSWQISTFWWASLWSGVGILLVVVSFVTASVKGLQNHSLSDALTIFFNPFMLLGSAIIMISTIWFWYRMIKGCILLNRDDSL